MILSLFNPVAALVSRSSDVVTLARPPLYSSLKVNNHSFRHASPRLWNELPKELRQPVDDECLSLSDDTA